MQSRNGGWACAMGAALGVVAWPAGAAPELVGTGLGAPVLRITELRVDQQGSDTDEYFEIAGTPGMALTDWWFVAIGDSGTDPGGVVEMAVNLGKYALGSNGYFVGHEVTFGTAVFEDRMLSVDPAAAHAVIGSGDSLNFENSDSVTYLLVRSFSGNVGLDLDPGNDGTLDITPWAELADSVAFMRSNSTDPVYSPVHVGPVDLSATGGMPPHAWWNGTTWQVGAYASWQFDTPGTGPAVPAPAAAPAVLAAAGLCRGYHRSRCRRS